MTTQANIPNKWYVPFAQGDATRVEIPVTTSDPTRASQTLGFPPLTMQPPESGGVPPQGEDFNGGMNQIARVAWWVLNGGGWPYDASFAANSNINGYPNGAKLQSADFRGDWINTSDNNQNNPDTTGTGWVPGYQYGVTALAGLTGGTTTPTPAQAAKDTITLSGTLGSAQTIILPTWLKSWRIINNTTGAFVTIVKTAAGSGVTIPQNGAPTRVTGDGTNIVQQGENVATATTATQAPQVAQLHSTYSVRGLTGTNNAGTPLTKYDLSATVVVMRNTTSGALTTRNGVSGITVDITVQGLNGRDQAGAFSPSTWVYYYFVPNGAGTAGVVSAVAPASGGPTGYTDWAFAGPVFLNGSTQLLRMVMKGAMMIYAGTQTAVVSGGATTETAVNVASLVPPNALSFVVSGQTLRGTSAANGDIQLSQNLGFISGLVCDQKGIGGNQVTNSGATTFGSNTGNTELPNVGQQFFYSITIILGTSPQIFLNILSFKVANGDA